MAPVHNSGHYELVELRHDSIERSPRLPIRGTELLGYRAGSDRLSDGPRFNVSAIVGDPVSHLVKV
jgi:hypothetical protein